MSTTRPQVRVRTKSKTAIKKVNISKNDKSQEPEDEDDEITMTFTPTEPQPADPEPEPELKFSPIPSSPIQSNTPEQKIVLRRSFVDKTTLNLQPKIMDDSDATTIITSEKGTPEESKDKEEQPSKNTSFKVKKLTKLPVMTNLPSPELLNQHSPKETPQMKKVLEKKNSMPFNMANLPKPEMAHVASPKPAVATQVSTPVKETVSTPTPAPTTPVPNEVVLLHDGSTPSIIIPSQEQQLPSYMTTQTTQLDTVTSILSLPAEEIKDLYPSDEDEDFELYLEAFKTPKPKSEDDDLNSLSKLQNDISETSLKFLGYVKNPFYDHKLAIQPNPITIPPLSKEEVMRLNELARKCRDQGDRNFRNYVLIQQLDKQLQKEYQKKMLSRRLSTISGIRRGSMAQGFKGIGVKDVVAEFRESDASLDETDQTHRTQQGKSMYDIKKCSKSWKSQMKNLQEKGILDRKSSMSNAIFPIAPYPFPSCASVTKNGYLPEWRYVLQTKRLLEAKKTNALNV